MVGKNAAVHIEEGNFKSDVFEEREVFMYLYWRIQQDLNCLGELLIFHDPRFSRAMRNWVRRNAGGIALAEGLNSGNALQARRN